MAGLQAAGRYLWERSRFALLRSLFRVVGRGLQRAYRAGQRKRMNRQSPLLAIVRKSALGALLGLSLTSESLLGQTSTIIELKTLGGTAITGMALNNAGQVTGYSRIAGDAEQHAFFYQAGGTLDLGTLGGPFSQGNAINNAGQV